MCQSYINGKKAFSEKKYDEAEALFLRAITESPETLESYSYLAKCCFLSGKNEEAIAYISEFIELCKSDPNEKVVSNAYDLLGQCHAAKKEGDKALLYYEKATEVDPKCASAWHNKGLLYMESAQSEADSVKSGELFVDARGCIEKSLEFCSENPLFLHSLASWYEQLIEVLKRKSEDEIALQSNITDNFELAIKYYKKAFAICEKKDSALKEIVLSNFVECLAQYGHHLYRNGKHDKAQEIYSKVLVYQSNHLAATNQMGMSLFKQGCFSKAREYFFSILGKTKDTQEIADAWLNIACTYRLEEKWEKAVGALQLAEEHAPEDPCIADEKKKLMESMQTDEAKYDGQAIQAATGCGDDGLALGQCHPLTSPGSTNLGVFSRAPSSSTGDDALSSTAGAAAR